MEQNKEYYAFISYKREDKKEAKRLQKALEYYRLPYNLRQENPKLPEYVRPVFRDMTDLEVGELTAQIHSALEQSHYLIVVCSPRAAASKWVNDEVEYFISLGKQDKIIPYIIEGIPHASNPTEECYPPALLKLSQEKELLGANINEVGKDSATIRVVSKMFNIRFDTLYQRYQREQIKRRWQLTVAIIFAFLFLSGVAGWIWYQNILLKEREWKMMENQARMVVEKANSLMDNGDVYLANRLLLAVVPDNKANQKPMFPELECALRRGYDMLTFNRNSSVSIIGHPFDGYPYSSGHPTTNFSPDGTQLVVFNSLDKVVRVYSSLSGKLQHTLTGHTKGIYNCVYNKNGNIMATSSSDDGVVILWDMISGKEYQRLSGHCEIVEDIVFSYSGNKIVTIAGNTCYLWNNQGVLLDTLSIQSKIGDVRFNNNDDMLSLSTIGYAKLISIRNNQLESIIDFPSTNNEWIYKTIFSADGNYCATCSDDNSVRIWDMSTYELHNQYVYTKYVCDIEFVNNEFIAIELGNDSVEIRDFFNDDIVKTWDEADILYTSSGPIVVVNKEDYIYFFNLCNGTYTFLKNSAEYLFSMDVNYKVGKAVTSTSEGYIRIYNLNAMDRTLIHAHNEYSKYSIKSLIQSKNGDLLLTCSRDKTAKLWDYVTGKNILTLAGHGEELYSAVFDKLEKRVLTRSYDKTARIWDLEGKTSPIILPHDFDVSNAIFINDDKIVVSCSGNDMYIWNSDNGMLENRIKFDIPNVNMDDLLSRSKIEICDLVYDTNRNRLIASHRDGVFRVWDFKTSRLIKEIKAHSEQSELILSDDYLISYSTDTKIKIWDADNYGILHTFDKHNSYVCDAILVPNSPFIITSSTDGQILKWNYKTGEFISTIIDNSARIQCISLNDNYLLASSNDNHIYVFDIENDVQVASHLVENEIYMKAIFSKYNNRILVPTTNGKILQYDFSPLNKVIESIKNIMDDYDLLSEELIVHHLNNTPRDKIDF